MRRSRYANTTRTALLLFLIGASNAAIAQAQPAGLAAVKLENVGHKVMREVSVVLGLAADRQGDRKAISALQDKVLTDLASRVHVVVHRYTNVPSIALRVSPEALAFLRTHPDVISVTEAVDVPTSGTSRQR